MLFSALPSRDSLAMFASRNQTTQKSSTDNPVKNSSTLPQLTAALLFSRHYKDLLFGLFVIFPVVILALISILHTVTITIYFGGPFLLQLVLPTIAAVLAVSLIVQKNAIYSLLSLMGVFLTTAGIYFSVGASYFALVFLLIGQGAVAILFLYAVILLPLSALQTSVERAKDGSQLAAIAVGLLALGHLLRSLGASFTSFFSSNQSLLTRAEPTSAEGLRYFVQTSTNDILAFTNLYTESSALFGLITLILLSALLGAIILATSTAVEEK